MFIIQDGCVAVWTGLCEVVVGCSLNLWYEWSLTVYWPPNLVVMHARWVLSGFKSPISLAQALQAVYGDGDPDVASGNCFGPTQSGHTYELLKSLTNEKLCVMVSSIPGQNVCV